MDRFIPSYVQLKHYLKHITNVQEHCHIKYESKHIKIYEIYETEAITSPRNNNILSFITDIGIWQQHFRPTNRKQ